MATALNVAIATGIMAFTPDQGAWIPGWMFLAFFRFFVGFGNAGLIAVDIPLVQEFVPAYKRGWVSGTDHRAAAGGQHAGRGVGRVSRTGHRLARPVPGRPRTGAARADDPLLGARIAALADAHGPAWRRRASRSPGRCRSIRGRSTLPTSIPEDVKAVPWIRVVQLSAQRGGGLPDRDQPDRRRRPPAVDHRAVRDGAADHAGRSLLPDDLCQPRRHRRPPVLLVPVRCDRPPGIGHADRLRAARSPWRSPDI